MISLFTLSDIQSPSVDVNTTSVSLQWNEPPPRLLGNPQRSITQYEVTTVQRNDGRSQIVFVIAEAGAVYTITSLQSPMAFDIRINVVINTEGQGEQSYDIGVVSLGGEITCADISSVHIIILVGKACMMRNSSLLC